MNKIIINLLALFFFVFLIATVNASYLANISTDKKALGENEVALLSLKIMNSSSATIKNTYIRLTSDESIVFVDGMEDKTMLVKTIENLKPNEMKELFFKVKMANTNNESQNIYAYYGETQETTNATVTKVDAIQYPVEVLMESRTINNSGTDQFEVDFSLTNNQDYNLSTFSVEMIAPAKFEVKTKPILIQGLEPKKTIKEKFVAQLPLRAKGEQNVVIAYGFFDSNGPHYFEKTFKVIIQNPNYDIMWVIGVVILFLAVYLFLKKGKGNNVKGTGDKK